MILIDLYKKLTVHGLILLVTWGIIRIKISRKFDFLIYILGADHAGYIKRIVSATKAMSNSKVDLICKVSQLVKLLIKMENLLKCSKKER